LRPENLAISDEEQSLMDKHDRRRNKKKIDFKTEERIDQAKNRSFITVLYLPEYLKYFFVRRGGVVESDKTF